MKRIVSLLLAVVMMLSVCGFAFAEEVPALTVSAFYEQLKTVLSEYSLHVWSYAETGVEEFIPCCAVCIGEPGAEDAVMLGLFLFLDAEGEYLPEENFDNAVPAQIKFYSSQDANRFWDSESGYSEAYTLAVILPMLCGIQAMDSTLTLEDALEILNESMYGDEQHFIDSEKNGNTYCFLISGDDNGEYHGLKLTPRAAE